MYLNIIGKLNLLPIWCSINYSMRAIVHAIYSWNFQQIVSYYCTSPRGSKEESMVVAELKFPGPVAGHESKTWSRNMRIPSIPASMLHSCSIIDITYKLIVSLHCDEVLFENIPLLHMNYITLQLLGLPSYVWFYFDLLVVYLLYVSVA